MSNVLISVASEFDKKGFTQADKGISALTKSVAKFAGSLALARKTQQAMLDYMADEKSTKILAQNLKNLGFAYGSTGAEEFIATMQKQTGILDDELRPAYAQLARVTGSTLETQKLMSLAFDVSAGSGKDFGSVINALSQAYVGNNKGLKSLNIGLTQTELKTKSFKEIVTVLNDEFKGAGGASLDSYAGKMALLQVATANASEAIGKSLLDALSLASGEGGFNAFIKDIESATAALSKMIQYAGRGLATLKLWLDPTKTMKEKLAQWKKLQIQFWAEDLAAKQQKAGIKVWYPVQKTAAETLSKLEKERLALLKKQTAEKRAQAVIDKANKALAAAQEMFDPQGIQIAAALQGNITEEQRARLLLMQKMWELEQAIKQENISQIELLTKQLLELTKQTAQLNANFALLNLINGLLDQIGFGRQLFDINNINQTIALLSQITGIKQTSQSVADLVGNDPKLAKAILVDAANAFAEEVVVNNLSNVPAGATATTSFAGTAYGEMLSYGSPKVNITIDGSVSNLIDVVVDGLQQKSASGVDTRILRNTGGYDW